MAQLKATTVNGDLTLQTGGKIVNSTDGTVEVIDTNIKLSGITQVVGKLTVSENRALIRETTTSDYSVLEFGNDTFAFLGGFFAAGSAVVNYGGAHSLNILNIQNAPLALGTNNTVRFTIAADGSITATGSITSGDTIIKGVNTVKSTVTTTGGGYTRKSVEATGTPAGTTTYFDITLNIPASSKLLGVQLRVDTALTAGETWSAAYITGSTTAIASVGTAVAKSTKVNKMHVDEITSATTNIRITRDAGNFTNAVGVIRAIAYYEVLETLSNAP